MRDRYRQTVISLELAKRIRGLGDVLRMDYEQYPDGFTLYRAMIGQVRRVFIPIICTTSWTPVVYINLDDDEFEKRLLSLWLI